ncbi:MAG: hypothetical protein D6795_12345 [Deltaproteobacteria bacterium]|nr:MAG: hypothetical protein D6795_12345 [Deltaproteobacteria bacterium]
MQEGSDSLSQGSSRGSTRRVGAGGIRFPIVSLLLLFAACGGSEGTLLGAEGCSGCPEIAIPGDLERTLLPDALDVTVVGRVTDAQGAGTWRLRNDGLPLVMEGGIHQRDEGFSLSLPALAGESLLEISFANDRGTARFSIRLLQEKTQHRDIRVLLTWDNPLSDLDLHLLRPGGTLGGDGDCYWGTCSPASAGGEANPPDWGVAGDSQDDPTNDLEAHEGFGPESIVLDGAERGDYQIVVTNFGDAQQGPSGADVTVLLEERTAGTFHRRIPADHDAVVPVAVVSWPAATVRGIEERE